MNKLEKIHAENMKTDLPEFGIGDDLVVEVKIVEGGKERVQSFRGTVIARNGAGIARPSPCAAWPLAKASSACCRCIRRA